MIRLLAIAISVVAALMNAACASSGNVSIAEATGASVASQLQKGRTSQAEVRRLFGDPMKTSFAGNGNETWEFEFTRLQSKPTNFIPYVSLVHSGEEGQKKSLVVFFDRNKVVQDYTMSSSQVDVSRGLIAH